MQEFCASTIAFACLVAMVGCGEERLMVPVVRFVDPSERVQLTTEVDATPPDTAKLDATTTVGWPSVKILDDTRFVLGAPTREVAVYTEALPVPANGLVAMMPLLSKAFDRAKAVVVETQWRRGSMWNDVDVQVAPILETPHGRQFEVRFPVTPGTAGKAVGVYVVANSADWGPRTSFTTRPVTILPGSRLEFAVGVTESSQKFGTVRFQVEVCASNDCRTISTAIVAPSPTGYMPWQDHRVELADLADQTVQFVFSTIADEGGAAFAAGVWANPIIYTPRSRAPDALNVILVSLDTLAAGHLPIYGYSRDTAPFLSDHFRRSGTVFDTCVAAATSTSPSHMAIFTGEQPSVHGVTTGMQALPEWISSLPETIRSAGIDTFAVTEDGWLGTQHGFGRGFDGYIENKSPDLMKPTGQVDVTFARAKAWLTDNRDKRFFLFLHTFQVHEPYAPPEKYGHLFADETRGSGTHSDVDIDRLQYDREIRYTDDELRMLFDVMMDLDLDENTVLIVTSDHGEAFGQHGWLQHSVHFHEAVVHVPLLIAGPTVPRGRRVLDPVGHIDIAPTILDLFSVTTSRQGGGTSLRSYLAATPLSVGVTRSRAYFTESWSPIALNAARKTVGFDAPSFNVRVGSRKLARYRTSDHSVLEYFNLATDPGELDPTFPNADEDAQQLKSLLEQYADSCSTRRAALFAARGSDARDTSVGEIGLAPDQERQLRALGYIQ